jgi:hypothetical protein
MDILASLLSHLNDIKLCLEMFIQIKHRSACVMLRSFIVSCCTSIAEIYDCLMNGSTSSTALLLELRAKRNDALTEIVDASRVMDGDDFHYLEPYIGVSLAISFVRRMFH